MKLVALSDTHGKHELLNSSLSGGGDLLIFAGDCCEDGFSKGATIDEVESFLAWFSGQPYTHKVFVAGNHDLPVQSNSSRVVAFARKSNVIYLENTFIDLEGVRIYGLPHSITQDYPDWWAFKLSDESQMDGILTQSPETASIVVSHMPPYCQNLAGSIGSLSLYQKIRSMGAKLSLFGHVHSGRGLAYDALVTYANVSVVNELCNIVHAPLSFDIRFNPQTKAIVDIDWVNKYDQL